MLLSKIKFYEAWRKRRLEHGLENAFRQKWEDFDLFFKNVCLFGFFVIILLLSGPSYQWVLLGVRKKYASGNWAVLFLVRRSQSLHMKSVHLRPRCWSKLFFSPFFQATGLLLYFTGTRRTEVDSWFQKFGHSDPGWFKFLISRLILQMSCFTAQTDNQRYDGTCGWPCTQEIATCGRSRNSQRSRRRVDKRFESHWIQMPFSFKVS